MENLAGFTKDFEALKEEKKEVWKFREKQIAEYIELLKSNSDVQLYKISLESIPEDITVTEMYSIREIVEESTPSPYQNGK